MHCRSRGRCCLLSLRSSVPTQRTTQRNKLFCFLTPRPGFYTRLHLWTQGRHPNLECGAPMPSTLLMLPSAVKSDGGRLESWAESEASFPQKVFFQRRPPCLTCFEAPQFRKLENGWLL